MTFNYAGLAATALAQIADKGRNITLRRVTEGSYNPATDTIPDASVANETVKALVRNFSQRELVEGLIIKGDKEVIVASSGLTIPEMNDIIVDNDQFRIVNVLEIKPGDTSMLYKLQVRR